MFNRVHLRGKSQSSQLKQTVDVNANDDVEPAVPAVKKKPSSRSLRIRPKLSTRNLLALPTVPKPQSFDTGNVPHELVPVLTLLAAHGHRIYNEGYFMILAELNNDGQPIADRKWVEVFGTLQGSILTMWNADTLDSGNLQTQFINLSDGYMRSVETLGQDLTNVIVLSTTMKNRYLLQFPSKKAFNEWTAGIRLSFYERTSLQEAYTGALLSYKGSQMNGIRHMLAEHTMRSESWCNIRFGVGMPWQRVWVVITPNAAIKDKKERKMCAPLGKVELYSDPKEVRKKKSKPLATIHQAFAIFAVFPEKAVLVNISSLIKIECVVEFEGDQSPRESALFLMPDQIPAVPGYETLIRFLIPVFDVFALYGRPKRLNADKYDVNSLLFGMPSLPNAYYLDVVDVYMLASLSESQSWAQNDWNAQIKELIARKLATGYRGTGNIGRHVPGVNGKRSSLLASPSLQNRSRHRDFSDPEQKLSDSSSITGPLRAAPPAPRRVVEESSSTSPEPPLLNGLSLKTRNSEPDVENLLHNPQAHQRVLSEGQERKPGLLTPNLHEMGGHFGNTLSSDATRLAPNEALTDELVEGQLDAQYRSPFEDQPDGVVDATGEPKSKYKGSHRSYQEYSEYMRQYLDRRSVMPKQDDLGEAVMVESDTSANDSDSDRSVTRVPVAGAKLVSTPTRRPELAQPAAADSAQDARDSPPETSASGPRIDAYPRQRHPSGPRPPPAARDGQHDGPGNSEVWEFDAPARRVNSENEPLSGSPTMRAVAPQFAMHNGSHPSLQEPFAIEPQQESSLPRNTNPPLAAPSGHAGFSPASGSGSSLSLPHSDVGSRTDVAPASGSHPHLPDMYGQPSNVPLQGQSHAPSPYSNAPVPQGHSLRQPPLYDQRAEFGGGSPNSPYGPPPGAHPSMAGPRYGPLPTNYPLANYPRAGGPGMVGPPSAAGPPMAGPPAQMQPFRKPVFVAGGPAPNPYVNPRSPGVNQNPMTMMNAMTPAMNYPHTQQYDPMRQAVLHHPSAGAPLAGGAQDIPTQKLNKTGDLRSARAKLMGGQFGI